MESSQLSSTPTDARKAVHVRDLVRAVESTERQIVSVADQLVTFTRHAQSVLKQNASATVSEQLGEQVHVLEAKLGAAVDARAFAQTALCERLKLDYPRLSDG